MCGGNPIRDVLRIMQTTQPRAQAIPARPSLPKTVLPTSPEPVKMACPVCGTQVEAHFSWCPSCGSALKTQPCEYCGQPLAPQDTTCPACGAPRSQKGANRVLRSTSSEF
jgi:predicted amidophosphoribosyltransferase